VTIRDAMDLLGLKAAEVAEIFDTPVQSVRQWRLDDTNSNYRPPPAGWQRKLLPIARRHGKKVAQLISELESMS
jgi:DNA-binding transcriptional regulator YiaG